MRNLLIIDICVKIAVLEIFVLKRSPKNLQLKPSEIYLLKLKL